MSLRFCTCGGLFEEQADESLEFVCVACNSTRSARPEDTMLSEDIVGKSLSNFDVMIRTAPDDRLNPIKKMSCEKCKKETYHNYIYLGENMTIIYSCLDCRHQTS